MGKIETRVMLYGGDWSNKLLNTLFKVQPIFLATNIFPLVASWCLIEKLISSPDAHAYTTLQCYCLVSVKKIIPITICVGFFLSFKVVFHEKNMGCLGITGWLCYFKLLQHKTMQFNFLIKKDSNIRTL